MTKDNGPNWLDYYQKLAGREPRQHLVKALEQVELKPDSEKLAIDIGFGDGTETAYLLENGWSVLAIDGEPASVEYLMKKVPPTLHSKLQTRVSKFESLAGLPSSQLVHSSYSLPFCPPEHFDRFWSVIVDGIQVGGYFAGQFFGPNDDWASSRSQLTFHSRNQVLALFKNFEILTLTEIDEDGNAASGPKHWHIFEVFAQRTV